MRAIFHALSGGVVAFIFADLIIAPILNIYRKYYGPRMSAFLLATFYAAMAGAGYVVEIVFGGLGLIASPSSAKVPDQGVSWDYTTWLNIAFLTLAAVLVIRFARTGGITMLKMMGGAAPERGGAGDGALGHHDTGGHGDHGDHADTRNTPRAPALTRVSGVAEPGWGPSARLATSSSGRPDRG